MIESCNTYVNFLERYYFAFFRVEKASSMDEDITQHVNIGIGGDECLKVLRFVVLTCC